MIKINENDTIKRLFTALLNAAARNADSNAECRRFNNMDIIKKTFKSAFENQDEESVKPFWNFLHDIAPANNHKYTDTYNYYLSWFKVIAADLNKVPDADFGLYREFYWNFLDRPSYMSLTMLIQAHNGVESAEGIRAYIEQYAEYLGSIACFDISLYEYEKEFLSGLGFTVSEPEPVEEEAEEVTIEIETEEDETDAVDNSEEVIEEENIMTKTTQVITREQDMLNWFYSTFKEFEGLNVDVQLLMKLYEMRLRASECKLTFKQYLHSYCYDLLMYSAGLVDESDPSYADLAVLYWLITEPSAYSDIESAIIMQQADKVLEDISADIVDTESVEGILQAAIKWDWARTLAEAEEFGRQFGRLNTPPQAASDKYLSPEAVSDLCELFRDRAAS